MNRETKKVSEQQQQQCSTTKLLHNDCFEAMQALEDHSIDMVCVDPPYGCTQCKWDTPIDLAKMWACLRRIVKPNGAIVIFSTQPFTSRLIGSNYEMFKQELIWRKNLASNFLNANRMHLAVHENICVFYDKMPTYNKQFGDGTPYKIVHKSGKEIGTCYKYINKRTAIINTDGKRHPVSVLEFDRPANNVRCHSSQKPVDLLKYLIATYSNKGETVLDFTMGSGSTGVAAVELERRFIGIEHSKEYFDMAQQRMSMSRQAWNEHVAEQKKVQRRAKKREQSDNAAATTATTATTTTAAAAVSTTKKPASKRLRRSSRMEQSNKKTSE